MAPDALGVGTNRKPVANKVGRHVTHQLELSQEQLEALASGVVLCFDQGGATLRVTADAKAVAAFKQHVHLALLAHLNPSNPSIQ